MKNIKKTMEKPAIKKNDPSNKLNDPLVIYKPVKTIPQLKDFTYEEFKKTADKVPFTLSEWAAILHVSERTLQRYAKNNGKFAPINAERFYQISQVLAKGKKVLGKTTWFYEWLHSNPPTLEGELSFNSLTTYDGIQKILTQLGRIEHGILA
jgi:AraC-like DNA-binding protein